MSFSANNSTSLASLLSSQDDSKRPYFCMDIWKIPAEVMSLPKRERYSAIMDKYVIEHVGPFPDDYFVNRTAPITWFEDMVAQLWFLFALGGAVFCLPILVLLFLVSGIQSALIFLFVLLILSFHPLPKMEDWMATSYVARCMYKYFSFRIIWTDDKRKFGSGKEGHDDDKIGGSLFIAGPHGVGALGNFVAIPAIAVSGIMKSRLLGCAADVVAKTPFLRYMTLFGLCSANKKTILDNLKNKENGLGLNPDGIAGIFQHYNDQTEPMYVLGRKGISKMILENDLEAIPCHIMGNSTVLTAVFDRFGIIKGVSRRIRASLIFFYGRWMLPIPHRIPIQICIGTPLTRPTLEKGSGVKQADIDDYHIQMMDGMKAVFDSHKGAYGWRKKKIQFL